MELFLKDTYILTRTMQFTNCHGTRRQLGLLPRWHTTSAITGCIGISIYPETGRNLFVQMHSNLHEITKIFNFRALHEINIFWAAHQVHHSSEDYNLSTALRQSMLQMFPSALFFLPLAYFIPPPIALVHAEFNTLFQFWIHTELIDGFGPVFNYFFNTPKQWSQNTFFRYFIF